MPDAVPVVVDEVLVVVLVVSVVPLAELVVAGVSVEVSVTL